MSGFAIPPPSPSELPRCEVCNWQGQCNAALIYPRRLNLCHEHHRELLHEVERWLASARKRDFVPGGGA